ncbi:MAG: dynamin family protein [Ilumatobacteraceae bacterium]
MSERLVSSVHRLLDEAEVLLRDPYSSRVPELRARLDGPLRVAIAGKVKAGKSTLLNALVGEKVAPTDAGECTRVVTWYRNSHVYRVTAVGFEGPPVELRFRRTEDALEVDLDGRIADQIRYLDVEWPSERLRDMVLIDTPGLASISEDVSRRTEHFLASDEEGPGDADAVIYLLRHLHPMDLSFLEAFRDTIGTRGASVNSIAVLSRADEIGASRTNALQAAERVAVRYREDPRIELLCQVVVPVAGLIAQAAPALREDETNALRLLAGLPRHQVTSLLLSTRRFIGRPAPPGLERDIRERLLDRLGLFGVRLAVELLVAERVGTTGDLARDLERRSGILELRELLAGQFTSRSSVLKARSTLATILSLADLQGGPQARRLRDLVRDIENAEHQLVEIRLLSQLKAGQAGLGDDAREARRVLGGGGPDPFLRLGLPPEAGPAAVREAAIATIGRWRMLAEDPLMAKDGRDIASGVIRTCEELAVSGT